MQRRRCAWATGSAGWATALAASRLSADGPRHGARDGLGGRPLSIIRVRGDLALLGMPGRAEDLPGEVSHRLKELGDGAGSEVKLEGRRGSPPVPRRAAAGGPPGRRAGGD